jgi:hypothetical protein
MRGDPVIAPDSGGVSGRRRYLLPLAGGAWAAAIAMLSLRVQLTSVPDFVIFWTAGRALVHGADPYQAVAALDRGYPFFYPMPAAMAMVPFGLFSWPTALILFMALSGGLLGLAALRHGRGLGPALLSAGFLNAVVEGQWTPLLVSAAVLPWVSPLLVTKPSIGLALWTWRPSRVAVAGGAALLALSIAIQPSWPGTWLAALRATNHVAPVLRPGGFILLLALLRWRTPEGRLLAALACVPHTSSLFETLPLFLIPRTRLQGYALACLSFAALATKQYTLSGATLEAKIASGWPALFVFLWLPALVLVFYPPSKSPADGAPRAEHP